MLRTHLAGWCVAAIVAVPGFAATTGDARLPDAAMRQDQSTVRTLLQQHANVNAAQPDGTTALQWAVHNDDLQMADLLLKAGADPKAANQFGVTPLSQAALNSNATMVERLLKAGADVNAVSPEGETALMTAAHTGSVETVKVLLAHGANVNAEEKWHNQTALIYAVAENHPDVVKLLIEKGADVNARSIAWEADTKKRKYANANVISPHPRGGFTALLYAARQGSLESAQLLADAKADLNAQEPDGVNALVLAVINAHYDVAGMLLDKGADPNVADKYGRTVLYAAVDMNTMEKSATRPDPHPTDKLTAFDVAKSALEHGANPNAKLTGPVPGRGSLDVPDFVLSAGGTPFLRAAKTGDVASMKLLLEHGADPAITTKDHTTAMMIAAGKGWKNELTRAKDEDQIAAIQLLLDKGADVNAANEKGETALHCAAAHGADKIVRFLIAKGANVNTENADGQRPLDYALGTGGKGFGTGGGSPAAAAALRELGGTATGKASPPPKFPL
jgi:ankyrin repeat protein